MLQLGMVHDRADLWLAVVYPLDAHTPQTTPNYLLSVNPAAELPEKKNHPNFGHVPALTQHQYAHDCLVRCGGLLLLAEFPRLLPILFVAVLGDEQGFFLEVSGKRLDRLPRVRLAD